MSGKIKLLNWKNKCLVMACCTAPFPPGKEKEDGAWFTAPFPRGREKEGWADMAPIWPRKYKL